MKMPKLPKMPDASDRWLALGFATVFYGVHQIYAPAAWIVLGLLCVALGVLTDLVPAKPKNPESN